MSKTVVFIDVNKDGSNLTDGVYLASFPDNEVYGSIFLKVQTKYLLRRKMV